MTSIAQLPRPEMKRIGREILSLLQARKAAGPPEQALDDFVPEVETIVSSLETGIDGQVATAAALKALLAKLEAADIEVDTWLRHHFYFIDVEAGRRAGPNVVGARALEAATFPDGLAHVDDYIPVENDHCRAAVAAIRSPEHAATLAAIKLPAEWTKAWEACLDASDAAFAEVQQARAGKSIHVIAGQDAEVGFIDVMTRLRKYIDSRASRSAKVKVAQSQALIQPLLDALAKMKATERARGTRKENAKKDGEKPAPTPEPPSPDAPAPGGGSP